MELEYYGGDGWGSCHETGIIEISYTEDGKNKKKVFSDREDAKEFYEGFDCEKTAWDLTRGAELIECHVIKQGECADGDLPFN